MAFDDTLTNPDGGEKCGWRIAMPGYDGGNITLYAFAKPATTPSGAVTLQFHIFTIGIATSEPFVRAIPVDTGVNLSFSMNTTELNTDCVLANATIDPANVVAGGLLVIELSRDTADTLVGDGHLIGFHLDYSR